MKYKISVLFLSLLFLFITHESCRKEPISACGVEQPEENIKWLKNFLINAYSIDVFKHYFDGTEYLILADPPGPDAVSAAYDCEGNFKCAIGGINAGNNTCYLTSTFWESYYKERILIYQQRIHP